MPPLPPAPARGDRLLPLAASLAVLVLGLAVHRTPSLPLADKLGDVLYAALVLLLLWLLRPLGGLVRLAAVACVWCLAVELLQLTAVPASLASRVPVTRLVLGSGFDALDLVAYAVGIGADASLVALTRARRAGHRRAG